MNITVYLQSDYRHSVFFPTALRLTQSRCGCLVGQRLQVGTSMLTPKGLAQSLTFLGWQRHAFSISDSVMSSTCELLKESVDSADQDTDSLASATARAELARADKLVKRMLKSPSSKSRSREIGLGAEFLEAYQQKVTGQGALMSHRASSDVITGRETGDEARIQRFQDACGCSAAAKSKRAKTGGGGASTAVGRSR
jgi:hypothetical protein